MNQSLYLYYDLKDFPRKKNILTPDYEYKQIK